MPSLFVDIEARYAQFQDSLDKIFGKTKSVADGMEKAFSAVKSTLAGLGVGLSVAGLVNLAKGAIESQDALHRLNLQTGLSVELLSSLRGVAKAAGTDLDTTAGLINKLEKNMLEFAQSGGGKAATAFQQLGFSQDQVREGLKNMDTFLPQFAKKLIETGVGGEQAGLAMQLLAKGGAAALPFLTELANQSQLIATRTKEEAEAAHELEVSFSKLTEQSKLLKESFVNELIPGLKEISEQMLIAKKNGEGFFGSLLVGAKEAAIQLFAPTLEGTLSKLQKVREEIIRIQSQGGEPALTEALLANLRKEERELEKKRDMIVDIAKFQKDLRDDAAKPPNKPLPPIEPPVKAGPSPFDNEVRALKDLILRTQELTRYEQELFHIEEGRFGKLLPAQRDQLLNLAAIADMEKNERDLKKEVADVIDKQNIATNERLNAEALARGVLADSIRKELDPLIELQKKLVDIAELEELGMLSEEDAAKAAALRYEETGKQLDALASKFDPVISKTKEVGGLGKDFGFIFQSAFENAVVSGKKFRDVLSGIAADIAKMVLRKGVTEPLGDIVGGLFKKKPGEPEGGSAIGDFFKKLFGGSFASGLDYVPRDMLALVHQGERIVPASENKGGWGGDIVMNFAGNPPDTQQFIAAVVPVMRSVARGEIGTQLRNGGVLQGA